MTERSILDEAREIVQGPRQKAYGHPREHFARVSNMWSAYLGHEVTPRQVTHLMALFKLARLGHDPQSRDSLVDAVAYLAIDDITKEPPLES